MSDPLIKPCAGFAGQALLAAGPLVEVALAVKKHLEQGELRPVLMFDDATGRVIDLDPRGTTAEMIARLAQAMAPRDTPGEETTGEARGRGRPKLGVVAREVSLLPRHWDWLQAQPGGASVTLRRLVEEARRDNGGLRQKRAAQEAGYRFMSAMAGDLPGFEEAARALFADDRARFDQCAGGWPEAIYQYAARLGFGGK